MWYKIVNTLETRADGSGTFQGVPKEYILENKERLLQAKATIIIASKTADGKKYAIEKRLSLDDFIEQLTTGLVGKIFILEKNWEAKLPPTSAEPAKAPDPLALKIKQYTALAPEQRAQTINEIRTKISELNKAKVPPEDKAQGIIDALAESAAINKVVLNIAHEARKSTKLDSTIAQDTLFIERNILEMTENGAILKSLFSYFKQLSNGQTLNHCIRVTTMMAGFIHFFNARLQESLATKLKLVFTEYRPLYSSIFPKLNEAKLNYYSLMKLGVISPQRMLLWLHGANFHDIGKLAELDYFESDQAYDPAIIQRHVLDGVGLFLMVYSAQFEEAKAMVGDHHYALMQGYSFTQWERQGNPRFNGQQKQAPEICITENYEDYAKGNAVGFLPVEMLSVIDIYDALTDSSRSYKKALTPVEALTLMYGKSVISGKLDPIIFDLFVDFLREQEIFVPQNLGFSVKYAKR